MTDRIERLLKRVEEFHPGTAAELEEFRIKVLGRKGDSSGAAVSGVASGWVASVTGSSCSVSSA